MPLTTDQLLDFLRQNGLGYRLYEHEAVFTAEQALKICGHIPGIHCKNLFLKDKDDAMWLVTLPDEKKADLKALPQRIGSKRLSFGNSALLSEALGVNPGSVTPFALINDAAKRVQPVLDRWMMDQELINVHPLANTATITLKTADLVRFMTLLGREPLVISL